MPELDREQVADYFARPGTVSEWWTPEAGPLRYHYDAELKVLCDRLPVDPGWRVLDVGTGRGRFGAHFAQLGCDVVGVDLNPDMVEAARETARKLGVEARFEILRVSAEDLSDFDDGCFDVVLCMELFDHLPDLGRALAEMRRVLSPEGRLLFTYVPSESLYGSLGNVYRWLRARTRPDEVMISRTYTLGEVRARLAECGLALERYWGIGLLCVNAQTRLFRRGPVVRALGAIARVEAARWPYHETPWVARHGAHVVGMARPAGGDDA